VTHTKPSLVAKWKPKKLIKKTFYTGVSIAPHTKTGFSADGLLCENEEEASLKFANYYALVPIVLVVEE
jgi:hypothetical protein